MNQPKAPASARVAAAIAILDRGWGKPKQPHGGEGDGEPIKHEHKVDDDINRKLDSIAAAIKTEGDPK